MPRQNPLRRGNFRDASATSATLRKLPERQLTASGTRRKNPGCAGKIRYAVEISGTAFNSFRDAAAKSGMALTKSATPR
jgi:hypothetical protein